MQSPDNEDWATLQFDLELTQPTPPTYLTPQPRLGTATLQDHLRTSDPLFVAMTANSQPYGQPLSRESADAEDAEDTKQELTPPRDQHRRGYQACDPCRKRKVKCDLGSK
jgi:Fungal Zn(2)-Cys(6) binuclear cluster domain